MTRSEVRFLPFNFSQGLRQSHRKGFRSVDEVAFA